MRRGWIRETRSRSCAPACSQGVTDPRVLAALRSVRRASFVPGGMRNEVGYDSAIPIGQAQTTSQPSLIGLMIEALDLGPEDTVLEIGTGYGYEAALLARLACSRVQCRAHRRAGTGCSSQSGR